MEPPKPKRRPRYKGTHPRKFEEKYKELQPDVYNDEVQKILGKGKTLAGSHRPICLKEILEILNPQPGDTALDVTMGYGGHSIEILKKIIPEGRLVALDQDPIEGPKAEKRLKEISENVTVGILNFRNAKNFLQSQGIKKVDLVLADLGLSSMQIDTPERGFSYKHDAPFDLRMNQKIGTPAWELFNTLDEKELAELLLENADEPHSRQIAQALMKHKPKNTTEVAKVVRSVVKTFSQKVREKERDTPLRRVFQALRILVNDELGALEEFLSFLPEILSKRGRVAILSFHSGEDRLVKKAFQNGYRSGVYKNISSEVIRPSPKEQYSNPRSRPAKLRFATIT